MKIVVTLLLVLVVILPLKAQNTWFSLYTDSTTLIRDATKIIGKMTDQIQQVNHRVRLKQNTAAKNTTPGLIYVFNDTINLPFWAEVIPQQKKFFTEIAGGEEEGKRVFGLLFNRFYLANELGHSLAASVGSEFANAYDAEYEANIIAILYWKAVGQTNTLQHCYAYASKMLKTLTNPVPSGEDAKTYLTQHYKELANDPYQYGYIQFSQFVAIYNDPSWPDFTRLLESIQSERCI